MAAGLRRPPALHKTDSVSRLAEAFQQDKEDLIIREFFAMLDENNSGFISSKELKKVLADLTITTSPEEFRQLWQHLDKDQDNRLSYEEFALGMKSWIPNIEQKLSSPPASPAAPSAAAPSTVPVLSSMARRSLVDLSEHMQRGHAQLELTRQSLKEMFRMCDSDGDGNLSLQELSRVLRELNIQTTARERTELFQQLDLDGNGSISFSEFALGLRFLGRSSSTPNAASSSTAPSSSSASSAPTPASGVSDASASMLLASRAAVTNLREEVETLTKHNELMSTYIGEFFESGVKKAAALAEEGTPASLLAAKNILEMLHFSGIGPLEKGLDRTLMTPWTLEHYKPLVLKIRETLRASSKT